VSKRCLAASLVPNSNLRKLNLSYYKIVYVEFETFQNLDHMVQHKRVGVGQGGGRRDRLGRRIDAQADSA